jgi:hypothetical protein
MYLNISPCHCSLLETPKETAYLLLLLLLLLLLREPRIPVQRVGAPLLCNLGLRLHRRSQTLSELDRRPRLDQRLEGQ